MDLFLTTCQGNQGNVGIQGYGLSTVRCQGKRETKKQGKEETRGYGLLPSTTLCQGSTQMDDLVAKQETIKGNGISSIQDLNTSRARKLSSHGDLAYCSARRYFGENIYNFCPSRTEFATRLEVDWRKIDAFALSGETGKRRNSRVWISFNHNALPGYRKLGHRFNRFRDEGRQLLVFFLVFGAQSLIAHYLFLIEGTDGGQVIKGMDCFNLYNQPLQGCHRTDPAE